MLHCCSRPNVLFVPCHPSTNPNPPLAHTQMEACCLQELLQTQASSQNTHTRTHRYWAGHRTPQPLPNVLAPSHPPCREKGALLATQPPQRPQTPSLTPPICQSASTVQPCSQCRTHHPAKQNDRKHQGHTGSHSPVPHTPTAAAHVLLSTCLSPAVKATRGCNTSGVCLSALHHTVRPCGC
jgi:hypothetical protein